MVRPVNDRFDEKFIPEVTNTENGRRGGLFHKYWYTRKPRKKKAKN